MEMIRRIRKEEIINLFEESLEDQVIGILPDTDPEAIKQFIRTLGFGDYKELEDYISNKKFDENSFLNYLVSKGFDVMTNSKTSTTESKEIKEDFYSPDKTTSPEEEEAAEFGLSALDANYLKKGEQVEVRDADGNFVVGTVEQDAGGNDRVLVRTPSGVRIYDNEDVFTDQDLGEDIQFQEELNELKRLSGIQEEDEEEIDEASSCGAISSGAIAGVNMSMNDIKDSGKKLRKKKKPGPKPKTKKIV